MVRNVFILVVVTLLSFALGAEVPSSALETEVKSSVKCPCKCYFGKQEEWAYRECRKSIYKYKCKVSTCYKHKYKGKWCCDRYVPLPTPDPATTTRGLKPKCPCKCVAYHIAAHQCKHNDYCEVKKCDHHHGHGYKYECCNK